MAYQRVEFVQFSKSALHSRIARAGVLLVDGGTRKKMAHGLRMLFIRKVIMIVVILLSNNNARSKLQSALLHNATTQACSLDVCMIKEVLHIDKEKCTFHLLPIHPK